MCTPPSIYPFYATNVQVEHLLAAEAVSLSTEGLQGERAPGQPQQPVASTTTTAGTSIQEDVTATGTGGGAAAGAGLGAPGGVLGSGGLTNYQPGIGAIAVKLESAKLDCHHHQGSRPSRCPPHSAPPVPRTRRRR